MSEKQDMFKYTYSAQQQAEIKAIREKYAPKVESQLELLRRLDASVTRPATIISLIVGIASTLVMGLGMCCTMVWADTLFLPGVLIGAIGIVGIILAYPIYSLMVRRKREKLAPEIMRLSEELLK